MSLINTALFRANAWLNGHKFRLADPQVGLANDGIPGMHGAGSFLRGGGKPKVEYRPTCEVVDRCATRAAGKGYHAPQVKTTRDGHWLIDVSAFTSYDPMRGDVVPGQHRRSRQVDMVRVPVHARAAATSSFVSVETVGDAIADIMQKDLFIQPVEQLFASFDEILTQRAHELTPEYQELAKNLAEQANPAKQQILEAAPQLVDKLRAIPKFAHASLGQLYQIAVQLIARELRPVLGTIQYWCLGFRQWLTPALRKNLMLVRAMIEQQIILTLGGDLRLDTLNKGDIKQRVPSIDVSVGDVVLVVLIGPFDAGPAVIPMTGALGPLGGHLAFLPWNLVRALPFEAPIYGHEATHLLQAIILRTAQQIARTIVSRESGEQVVKYMEELAQVAIDAIDNCKDPLEEEEIPWGGQKLPAREWYKLLFVSQEPEVDADHGGSRTYGPKAFGRTFLTYLRSMTKLMATDPAKLDTFLRMVAPFSLPKGEDGKIHIKPEAHPHDGPRVAIILAIIAELMGYPEMATWLRAAGNRYAGNPMPTRMKSVYQAPESDEDDGDGQDGGDEDGSQGILRGIGSRLRDTIIWVVERAAQAVKPKVPDIEFSVKDYETMARAVLTAWYKKGLFTLNGLSLSELVNLSPDKHKEKVDPVKDMFVSIALAKSDAERKSMAKLAKLQEKSGHQYFNTLNAGFVEAIGDLTERPELVKQHGMSASQVLELLVPYAFDLNYEILDAWEAQKERLQFYKLTPADVQPDLQAA